MAIVMEYLPGGNLNNLVKNKRNKLDAVLRLRACVEVSDAISFIHNLTEDKRLVHGDIKPENVLVSDELHFKLGDFGGAKLSTYTNRGAGFGLDSLERQTLTPLYAAPERLALVPIEPRRNQDTYSFGLIIYTVLTGEEPFARYVSNQTYLRAIVQGKRPDTKPIEELKRSMKTSREKEIISTLESLMIRCWDHRPDERPNMLDVRDQLQQLLKKTKPIDVMQSVMEAMKRMNISPPSKSDHPCAPLSDFDTITKQFPRGQRQQPQPLQKVNLPLKDIFYPSNQTGLPGNVRSAPDFLKNYKTLLENQKYEEAKRIRTSLTSMIEDNIETTAENVKLFGEKLLKEKKHLESIAIFDAAAILFSKLKNPEEDLYKMGKCVCGMNKANIAMIGDDANNKGIVRGHVIPLMRSWLRQMQNTSQVSVKWRCLKVSWVLHYIEYSEYLVEQWEEREQTLRGAITGMREVFGSDVSRDHGRLFGLLLNNLGAVCKRTSRFEEAASFYKHAIDANKAATDYSDEEERKKDIAKSENNLKIVQQKMK